MKFNITNNLKELIKDYNEENSSEIIESILYNPTELTDKDHDLIDQLGEKFLRIAAQIFVEDLAYDFNTLVNYWEAFIGQLTEEQSKKLLNFAIDQTDVDFVEDFIIGYRKFYTNPKESITFFNKIDENEFYEIKFFKARCYEVLEDYEKAIEEYNNYLSSPYFQQDDNLEQAAVNKFYIDHTVASLLVKQKDYTKAIEYFENILNKFEFEEYLANFDSSSKEEIKSFLEDYIIALENIGNFEKTNDIKAKITKFFS